MAPLVITSVVTPISFCANMINIQNQTKEDKQQQNIVTYDDLCYMRQNALINFSRLSKQKQNKINNLEISSSGENFSNLIDLIFKDDKNSYSQKSNLIFSLCTKYKIDIYDYKNILNTFKDNFTTYFSDQVKNKFSNLLEYSKKNYLTKTDIKNRFDKFSLECLSNSTSTDSIKSITSIKLKNLLKSSTNKNLSQNDTRKK